MQKKSITYNKQDIHLSLKNFFGSVEHYYHFLLGFLAPVIIAHTNIYNAKSKQNVYIRSCAIMDDHLIGINLPEVNIISKFEHKRLKVEESERTSGNSKLKFIEYDGYDDPAKYIYKDFCTVNSVVKKQLNSEIKRFKQEFNVSNFDNSPKIVLINREVAHPFYSTDISEIKSAGSARRSIANFDDLEQSIVKQHKNTLSVTLENKSLAYQIALFSYADVIIAQHGASLANIIWCNSEATIIEIFPTDMQKAVIMKDHFKNLAKCMKIDYKKIIQEHSHSEVNINRVLTSITESLND